MGVFDDGEGTALAAGLRYVSDDEPGIRRVRRGRGFSYLDQTGEVVADPEERSRIAALAVPPAWTDVWICPDPDGHILATGRDQKGRKQYRYHPRWREVRDDGKFDRMGEFSQALPELRAQADADLRRPGLPEEKVLALVVRLLDETLIRIGNTEYTDANESYGLTTLRADDVEVNTSTVMFDFVAKGGAETQVALRDPRLARIVRACEELGGYELLAYRDSDGRVVDVDSSDVNDYLRSISSEDFSSKDFRTWGATVVAAERLLHGDPVDSEREAKRTVLAAIDAAADALGDTRAVARSSYVAPSVLDAYVERTLFGAWRSARRTRWMRRVERAVAKIVTADDRAS